jgi:hypothetical protein
MCGRIDAQNPVFSQFSLKRSEANGLLGLFESEIPGCDGFARKASFGLKEILERKKNELTSLKNSSIFPPKFLQSKGALKVHLKLLDPGRDVTASLAKVHLKLFELK